MATWNEMGNNNSSLKEEGNVVASALDQGKSVTHDAREDVEAVLHLAEGEEKVDQAMEKSMQDAASRDYMRREKGSILVQEPMDIPQNADEVALDSNCEAGLRDGGMNLEITERNSREQVDVTPDVVEKENQEEHEDDGNGIVIDSLHTNVEDTASSFDANAERTMSERESAEYGMGKLVESLSGSVDSQTSFEGFEEQLQQTESQACLPASNESGSMDIQDNIVFSTSPLSVNEFEESMNTVEEILGADVNIGLKTDKPVMDMQSQDNNGSRFEQFEAELYNGTKKKISNLGETGDLVGDGFKNEANSQSYSFSSSDPVGAVLNHDRPLHFQPDDVTNEDESRCLVKPTDLTGNLFTADVRETRGDFKYGANQPPLKDTPVLDVANTDARRKIEDDSECQVDEEYKFEAVKAPEIGSAKEGCQTSSDELPDHVVMQAELKEVLDGVTEPEKLRTNKSSDMKNDARVCDENVQIQTFDPLKLNLQGLNPIPINEAALIVGSCCSGFSVEEKELQDYRSQGSRPDMAKHLHTKKSSSFDFDLRIIRTEESDRTPLLFRDKCAVRASATTEYTNSDRKKLAIAKEKVLSFDMADSRTPSVGFIREEEERDGFRNNDVPEKQDHSRKAEKVILLDPTKELKVVDGPNSPQGKGKRRPRSFLFGNCMCCATVIN